MNERQAEHDQLRASMARFAMLMDAAPEGNHAELLRERMLFAQMFNAHLAREHVEVEGLPRTEPALADKMHVRSRSIGQLRSDYSDHVRRWTPPRIRSDWHDYRTEVLILQKRLSEFMTWEERNLPLYA